MIKPRLLCALCLTLICTHAGAKDRPFLDEMSNENKLVEDGAPWKEGTHSLPPYPQEDDLAAFNVDLPGSPFTYLLDERHLSVGEDGVVRYTLVIRSKSGAWNVSHEGMRCNVREIKVYAYGGGRGVLKAMKHPQWERMNINDPTRYHMDLREFYLCPPDQTEPNSKEEIVRLLHTAPRRNDAPGFLFE